MCFQSVWGIGFQRFQSVAGSLYSLVRFPFLICYSFILFRYSYGCFHPPLFISFRCSLIMIIFICLNHFLLFISFSLCLFSFINSLVLFFMYIFDMFYVFSLFSPFNLLFYFFFVLLYFYCKLIHLDWTLVQLLLFLNVLHK